jgi:hypothetical protein
MYACNKNADGMHSSATGLVSSTCDQTALCTLCTVCILAIADGACGQVTRTDEAQAIPNRPTSLARVKQVETRHPASCNLGQRAAAELPRPLGTWRSVVRRNLFFGIRASGHVWSTCRVGLAHRSWDRWWTEPIYTDLAAISARKRDDRDGQQRHFDGKARHRYRSRDACPTVRPSLRGWARRLRRRRAFDRGRHRSR